MSTVNPRRAALDILIEVERGGYANLLVKQALTDQMSDENRRFATALLYTTLDNLLYLDFVIDSFAKGRLQMPVRCILRLGICQLLYMDVPESAACNESVKLAKAIGKQAVSGFVNGTLRTVARSKHALPQPSGTSAQVLSIKHSWPLWLVSRFVERFGEQEAEAFLSFRSTPSLTVRENLFKASKGEIESSLTARGIAFKQGWFAPEALIIQSPVNIAQEPLFMEGKLTVQGESSMLVGRIADPKKGMKVLDACAAPGGKSLHMAAIMGEGSITAWDVHDHRVELIQKSCLRMGVDFIHAAVQDATVYREEYDQAFDVVLLDAPCSGLGVTGSKPDVKYSKSADDIDALCALQRRLLENCSNYVRKGGTLIYSTCTISREENEDNVAWFLSNHSDFKADELLRFMPEGFDHARAMGGKVQLFPHVDGVDGFFVSRMVR